jgi:hypothetical protein
MRPFQAVTTALDKENAAGVRLRNVPLKFHTNVNSSFRRIGADTLKALFLHTNVLRMCSKNWLGQGYRSRYDYATGWTVLGSNPGRGKRFPNFSNRQDRLWDPHSDLSRFFPASNVEEA